MSVDINAIQTASQEWQTFQNCYNTAGAALSNVTATGTTLYSDPTFAALFPNTWPAYQAYLVTLGGAINTFLASLPPPPPLNG